MTGSATPPSGPQSATPPSGPLAALGPAPTDDVALPPSEVETEEAEIPPSIRKAAPPSGAAIASIFEPADTHGRPRGQDIRVSIEVPSHALGDAGGYFVALPLHVEHEGALVERNLVKAEDERGIRLFLPEALQSPTTLRLRGQGGRCDDGIAGDLFVQISVIPSRALVPIASRPLVVGAGATLLLALAAALAVLL